MYEVMHARMNDSILSARKIMEGTLDNLEQTMIWAIFPPVLPQRVDLMQGTSKLLFGDSISASFIVFNDLTQDLIIVFNGHSENGFPVDWWIVGPEDELLDRRHLKYGFKLRDVFKKGGKTVLKAGMKVIDLLRDVRNERTPQYSHSEYYLAPLWVMSLVDLFIQPSALEILGALWDGLNAKMAYKLHDSFFTVAPQPPMLQTLAYQPRGPFLIRFGGLM